MIAQHQDRVIAKVLNQTLTLFSANGHPFKIVIADLVLEVTGVEIGRNKPVLMTANRHRSGRVHVADRIGARTEMFVEVGMLGEASLVHHIRRAADIVAFDVDLDEVRCGHFVIKQTKRVDEERVFLPRHFQRNVVIDRFRPAEVVKNAVASSQIEARLPFFFADLTFEAFWLFELRCHSGIPSLVFSFVVLSHGLAELRKNFAW